MAWCSTVGLGALGAVGWPWSPPGEQPAWSKVSRRIHRPTQGWRTRRRTRIAGPPLRRSESEVVNDRSQKRVLVHCGLRGAALHRASPERIGQIEDELLDADPSAQAEAEKVVGATLSRL